MIQIINKEECCGCWACENICKHGCIEMVEDNEGYRYPKVNLVQCINCGLCDNVCPVKKPLIKDENNDIRSYLVQNRDVAILQESTSGGAFSAIAKWVIKQGGVVFGAAFSQNNEVLHIEVARYEDLHLFRNSKYVQSLINDTYKLAETRLKEGRYVCFSGTPCQLQGLLKYLRKPYEKLITVDVVCRAVPSPLVLRKYLQMQQRYYRFTNIKFRDKYHGYKYSSMSLTGGDKEYHEGIDTDYYLRSFFSGINIRPSCTMCKFRSINRNTDFTIWDCFDVYRFNKAFDNDKGTTRMLVHTSKGNTILREIVEDLKVCEIDLVQATKGVKEFEISPFANSLRNSFFGDLEKMDPEACFIKYFPITIRNRIEKERGYGVVNLVFIN